MKNSSAASGIHPYEPAACLRAVGEDALAFLQGQFTQELRPGSGPPVAYGLWLNQKGKVLADSVILRLTDGELWIMSLDTPAYTLRERLEAFIIADDVAIEEPPGVWRGLAFIGPRAAEWLSEKIGGLPGEGEWKRVGAGFVFRGRRGVAESWEWLSPEPFPDMTGLPLLSGADMERLRIEAGIPRVPIDIGPGELPNEGGLDAVAISYTKGCYLGQEVMARLKAMGQVRRRLFRVRSAHPHTCALPAALHQGERKVGELRSLATGDDGMVGLALCSLIGLDQAKPLSLAGSGSADFTIDSPHD